MGMLESVDSLSDYAERFAPDPDDETAVVLLRWDNMADPLTSDLCTKIAGWNDPDDVPLWTPKAQVDWYYVDEDENVFTIDEMIAGEPEWYTPPEELPEWYEDEDDS